DSWRAETDLDWAAAAIIGSINSQICDEDHLKADGANYAAWSNFIDERMCDAVNKPMYVYMLLLFLAW
ncbi:uncharacterized protein VP01_4835g1, partial [Puccinia sorghi]